MSVSIIIKTLNEAERLAATIESALAAAGPDGEVIVADSGSTDDTVAIARRYPVTVVEKAADEPPSCGLGPQLGFQHASRPYICLMDGDMLLQPEFLPRALAFLKANARVAGVTGRIVEMNLESLEYARRVSRGGAEFDAGPVNRLNGGGVFRRAAIDAVGYLSDRNLHSYEELELGLRLRQQGWALHRLDIDFVQHFGHRSNAYALLLRRWQTRYLFGIGEVLRSALGRPHFAAVLGELTELRLWAGVYAWWLASLAMLLLMPDKAMATAAVAALAMLIVLLVSIKKRSAAMGVYTVIAWLFHAAALPIGLLSPRRDPARPIGGTVSYGAGAPAARKTAVPPRLETSND
jgi:glycosyltransferase involved in cell wall biosynthesis